MKSLWMLVGLFCLAACGVADTGAVSDESRKSVLALSATNESCDTLPPDRRLQGGGSFTSTRSYGRSGCQSGYLIDLDDYNPSGAAGGLKTLVSYADTKPTNQTDCEKLNTRVYVWQRNSDGSTRYLGGSFPRGRWTQDIKGGFYCEGPVVVVDDRIEGFVPGGDYRLGIRAHARDASNRVLRRKFSFSAPSVGGVSLDAGCTDTAADATIQSAGDTASSTTVNTAGCYGGTVVDLPAYAPATPDGTMLIDAGSSTLDPTQCANTAVRAYVWKKNPETGVYERLLSQTGSHGVTRRALMVEVEPGKHQCRRPYLVLERDFPGLLIGGDYRVAFRAHRDLPTGRELRKATLVTPQPPDTPSRALGKMQRLLASTAAMDDLIRARDSVSPKSRELACRVAEVESVLLQRVAPALTALGVTLDTANAYARSRSTLHEVYCGPLFETAFFPHFFRQTVTELLRGYTQIVDQTAAHIGIDQDMSVNLVERLLYDTAADLMGACQPAETLVDFVFTGALPANGATRTQQFENALFPACGGGSGAGVRAGDSAQEMADAIASGRGLGGTFRRCVNDVMEKELEDNQCRDPRTIDVGPPLPSETINWCMERQTNDEIDACIRAAQEARAQREADQAERDAQASNNHEPCNFHGMEQQICLLAEEHLNALPSRITDPTIKFPTPDDPVDSMLERGLKWVLGVDLSVPNVSHLYGVIFDYVLDGAKDAARGITKIQEAELRRWCQYRPTHPSCEGLDGGDAGGGERRCLGETFGSQGVAYGTANASFGIRPMTMFDRMDACYCEYMGRPVFGQDCMSPEERQRQECVTNPWGPDDGPRPECIGFLKETSALDSSALLGGMCQYVRPNCNGFRYIDVNGECGCWQTSGGDADPRQLCLSQNAINCGPDSIFDQRSCGCQPFDAGSKPWGGNPLCGNDPGFSPGGRDAFITREPNDLLTNRFYDIAGEDELDFHMVRAGGFVPVTSPALFTRSFDELGTRLNLQVKMPDVVGSSGYRGAAQLYCTSENVNNRFLDQRELQNLALGGVHTLGFELSPQDLQACTGTDGAWRLEIAVNSDPQTVQRFGFGQIDFGGQPVAVDSPVGLCPPAPDPAPTLPPILITPGQTDDSIFLPTTWIFSNGDTIALRDMLIR